MRELWDRRSDRAVVEAAGVQVVDSRQEPFMDAMQPVYDKLVTDPKLKAMVKRVRTSSSS